MSTLAEIINTDLIKALKSKEETKISTLRLLKSALEKAKKAKKKEEQLTEEEAIKVLRSEVKKRQEAIASYQQGQRQDLVQKEEAELSVLKNFLPPELSEEEINKVASKVISENNFSQKDFGQAMKLVMTELKGQADGKVVAELVKGQLIVEEE